MICFMKISLLPPLMIMSFLISLFFSCVVQELGGVLGDSFWADGMRLKVQILATRKLEPETASLKITELEDGTCTKLFPLESA